MTEEAEAGPDAGETIFPAEETADPNADETSNSDGGSAKAPAEDFYAPEAETAPADQAGQDAGWDLPAEGILPDDQADPSFQDANGLPSDEPELFPAETGAAAPAETSLPGQNQTQSSDNPFQEQIQTDPSDILFQEQIQTDLSEILFQEQNQTDPSGN